MAFSVCSEVSFAVNVHQLGHDHPQKMFASRVWQVSWNHLKGGFLRSDELFLCFLDVFFWNRLKV